MFPLADASSCGIVKQFFVLLVWKGLAIVNPTALSGLRAPLRWAGSKRALVPLLRELSPSDFARYVEPFFGSGCLYFDLRPPIALVGDFNPDLIQFYEAVRDDSEAVLAAFGNWNRADYYEVRKILPGSLSHVERAARFLYLNRNAFNGVYRTNREGLFNVPLGTKTGSLPSPSEFEEIAAALATCTIVCGDYRATLAEAREGDFVYLDPPYVNAARMTYGEYGYGSFGEDRDISGLAAELQRLDRLGAKVLFSFGSIQGLEECLAAWKVRSVSVRRKVAASAIARLENKQEILAWNY